jgi:hypothetical protein
MLACPSCKFPVQDEWNTCRRCGTGLPLHLREEAAQPVRASTLPLARARSAPAFPLPPPPSDTVLPDARRKGLDTLLPATGSSPTANSLERTKAAAIVAVNVALERLRSRKPRR